MKSLDFIHRIRRGDNVIAVGPRRIARQSSPNRQAIERIQGENLENGEGFI